eukprot:15475976-Alexandrium_andersonii.AAC.1
MRLLGAITGAAALASAPPRRSAAWAAARTTLEGLCEAPGAIRSWQALYRLLHRQPAPAHISWGDLLLEFTDADLRAAVRAGAGTGLRLASWN